MATERVLCPVCGEAFDRAPARCFRCETDLSPWWPLDEALVALGRSHATPATLVPADPGGGDRLGWRSAGLFLGGLAAGAIVGAVGASYRGQREAPAPAAIAVPMPPPRVVPPSTATPAPAALRYVVQPGDSLWRIAASLRGDGRRWPELLVDADGVEALRLRPGQELRIRLDPASSR